ncbi:hypothetical protein BSKO_11279 [Bryopsis sp. KO-2023]|nr:hypothetical protein BSKO_11279 [Bryopsis sp. KO-2023]
MDGSLEVDPQVDIENHGNAGNSKIEDGPCSKNDVPEVIVETKQDGAELTAPEIDEKQTNERTLISVQKVRQSLSNLNRTADGLTCAYLNLIINNTDMKSAALLKGYIHVQKLDLKNNMLEETSDLGNMRHLTELDLSQNRLQEALSIFPEPSNLRKAVLTANQIERVRDLSGFMRLSTLVMDDNSIRKMEGISGLQFLTVLSMKKNLLSSCSGLEELRMLRELYLDENRICSLKPLAVVTSLEVLTTAKNRLKDLAGVQTLQRLRKLDVSSNQIPTLEDIHHARSAAFLDELCILGNPLEQVLHFRLHTVHLLPQVTTLDQQRVGEKEKVLAANLHGADAEDLRAIRKKWFPNGELDDGGGAILPTSAGMVASDGSDSCCEGPPYLQQDFEQVLAQANREAHSDGISGLAKFLSKGCSDHLTLCMRVWSWVARHVNPPDQTWQVGTPVFLAEHNYLEELVSGVSGMWSERVTWLFREILHCCDVPVVLISGYCKTENIWPGERRAAHNHCWSAVQINKRWRLLDIAWAAQRRGHAPFYISPEVFINRCFPLEAHWQLLQEPIGLEEFWKLPMCSIMFLQSGLALVDPTLTDVVTLEKGREGGPTPTLMLQISAPHRFRLRHKLLDADHIHIEQSEQPMLFAKTSEDDSRTLHELWTAFPSYGTFFIVVEMEEDVPVAVRLRIHETQDEIPLNIYESQEVDVFRLKVVVPPPEPLDPARPLPASPFTRIAFQESSPTVIALGCKLAQLVEERAPLKEA